jgi:hypothetical protein
MKNMKKPQREKPETGVRRVNAQSGSDSEDATDGQGLVTSWRVPAPEWVRLLKL